ncbi:hypothetical protein H6G93_39305, partial [Nostoc sp. FACHB-973]|nr:hypothetical protein [Nostoc sp. FACHB-973]
MQTTKALQKLLEVLRLGSDRPHPLIAPSPHPLIAPLPHHCQEQIVPELGGGDRQNLFLFEPENGEAI